MELPRDALRLRIYVGEDKLHGGRPLYEAIALKAREQHLAGATVLHGTLGFGHSTRIHTASVLFSQDLPIVIEIVDRPPKIEAFVALLQGVPEIGLVTLDAVTIVQHGTAAA